MKANVSFDAVFQNRLDDTQLFNKLISVINDMNEKYVEMTYNIVDYTSTMFDNIYPTIEDSRTTRVHLDAIFCTWLSVEGKLLDNLINVVNEMNTRSIVKTYAIKEIKDE